jgi:hypothetical protein
VKRQAFKRQRKIDHYDLSSMLLPLIQNPSIHAQLIFSYQDITWADQLLEWNPTPGFVRGKLVEHEWMGFFSVKGKTESHCEAPSLQKTEKNRPL